MDLKIIRFTSNELVTALLAQRAELKEDDQGYFVNGWTQGIAEIDLYNESNNATYVCWITDKGKTVGVKAYFNQFQIINLQSK